VAPKEAKSAPKNSQAQIENISQDGSDLWSKGMTAARAQELLKLTEDKITIPEIIYANTPKYFKKDREQIKHNYLRRREFILSELAAGRRPHFSDDADGTHTFKTVMKVENSRSIGSLLDKFHLRLIVKGVRKIQGFFEINTARTGFIPGPSLVGTEGPKFKDAKGLWANPRAENEISGIPHEFGIHNLADPDNRKIFDNLIINGLSGGVIHDPRNGGNFKITESTVRYGKFIDKLNQISLPGAPNGFLSKLEELVANKDKDSNKPLRVLEYKSIPRILINHPDFKVKDYYDYIHLVETNRKEGGDDASFFEKLNNSGIKLPKEYYDPANPPATEDTLTRQVRTSMLACLTPHAFNSDNVVDSKRKIQFYATLAKFARSEEAQNWAFENYKIPKGSPLFSINGKDVSHVDFDDFEKSYASIGAMKDSLENKGIDCPTAIIKVAENDQPYCEFAPNSSKSDILPDIEHVLQHGKTVIGSGDSPGTDAPLLAQSIILGGAGFIVRGLMSESQVGNSITELLAKPENQWHKYALTEIPILDANAKKIGADYKYNETGEIKSKAEWTEFFAGEKGIYRKQIHRCNNIHENNAFTAGIFSELFAGDKEFKMELDENAPWVKHVLEEACTRSLVTPISTQAETAMHGMVFEKPVLEQFPFLNKIPFVKDIFDPYKMGGAFSGMWKGVAYALIGAAPVEIIADFMGMSGLAKTAGIVQRISYGLNNIASGVGRGLTQSAHKFWWQFNGEVLGLLSAIVGNNTHGLTLRALANTVLVGRANENAMRDNYNLDDFKNKKAVKEIYKNNPYLDKKKVAAELTTNMMKTIDNLDNNFLGGALGKVPGGKMLAGSLAQFMQSTKLAKDFFTIPGLPTTTLKNFFSLGQQGHTKISKNSGKQYGEVHEANSYAFTGMATLLTAISSFVLGKATGNEKLPMILTNIANMIPALGIVTNGKLSRQDQAGNPRLFTDVAGKQQHYSPEKAGMLQMVSGWMMAAFGTMFHTRTGAALYNMANGLYFLGIREEMKVGIDDAAVNLLTRQGRYYKDPHKNTAVSKAEQINKVHQSTANYAQAA